MEDKELKERMYKLLNMHLEITDFLYANIKDAGWLNEQFALDWLDKINEISVRN